MPSQIFPASVKKSGVLIFFFFLINLVHAQIQVHTPQNLPVRESNKISSSTCLTSTFFKHFYLPGFKVNIKKVQTTKDGSFLLAGSIIFPNNDEEGLLCIMNNNGILINQNRFRINDKQLGIYTSKVKANGKILIAGIVHDAPDKVFIAQLSSNLTTDWVKIITTPAAPLDVKLDCAYNDDVFFAVNLGNFIYYSLLNVSGTYIWSNTMSPAGLNSLAGIGHLDFAQLGILTNCTRAGLKVTEQTTINQSTGANVTVPYTVGNATDENYFTGMSSYGNRFIFSGVRKGNAAQFKLMRVIGYQSTGSEVEHAYTIPGTVDFNTSAAMDNAGDAMGFCFPAQGKLIFLRQHSSYQTNLDFTREYTVPTGTNISSITRSWIDGGFLFALNSADSSNFMLVKTDSIGTLPVCGSQTLNTSFTETFNLQNTAVLTTTGAASNNSVSTTLSSTFVSLNVTADCNETWCPPAPVDDTCLSTYYKILRTNSHYDGFNDFYLMRNNIKLVVTVRNDRIWDENSNVYSLKRFDEKGNFMNAVKLLPGANGSIYLSRRVNDQHIIFVTATTVNNLLALTFTLVNDNLQIVWTKTVGTSYQGWEFNFSSYAFDIITDAQGNIYMVANNLGFNETRKVLIYKMNAAGDQQWLKIYDVPGGIFGGTSATCTNTSLVAVTEGNPRSSSIRVDLATGQLLNTYTFNTFYSGNSYHRFLKFSNGTIFYGGDNGNGHMTVNLLDSTGRAFRAKEINTSATNGRIMAVRDGNLFMAYGYNNGSVSRKVLIKTDTALSVIFAKEFINSDLPTPGGHMQISDEGNIYTAGNYTYGGLYGDHHAQMFAKFDSDGNLGTCGSINYAVPFVDYALNVQTAASNPFTTTFTPIAPIAMIFTPDTMGHRIDRILCSSALQCNSLNLTGNNIICQLNQPFTYQANRNPGCTGTATWLYDTTYAVLQTSTDTSATFTFRITGNTWLKTKISVGCSFIIDSMLIQIQNSPQFFSLGADAALCPGSTIQLHAGAGFNTYQWQDNSTDSVFTVAQPGTYHVHVTNLCGDNFRDTIIINPAIIPAFNIGSDASICYADTLQLTASSGFVNYSWQPAAQINGVGQQVFIIPLQNLQVTSIATTADGCKAYDTLNIVSIAARPIWLGIDTSFCQGGSVTLSAGAGYTQYSWNTGAITASITASQAGMYSVNARDANGCYAKDSLRVIQVYTNPKPPLGNNFSICNNEFKVLDAGYYASYVWSNGSVNRSLSVNTPGDYWVQVTDNHNCKGADTVTLVGLLPLPGNFLKPVDSICQREILTINAPAGYQTYLWSTGATSPAVQVTAPGRYMLAVTNDNNCSGKDTITIVAKNCTKAIYFPNAFTPGNDNRNEVFKASVFGTLLSFKLQVFNRYGQLVFFSTDPSKGWDGRYKGQLQPTSTFTWHCTYLFAGMIHSSEQGTVILLR